jgi:hypothetical protein
MLAADYMPWSVRIPHTLEILADEFVYAGALALLLARRSAVVAQPSPSVERSPAV